MDSDLDIKIFAPETPAQPSGEDLDSLAAQTEALRESGNLDRAKRLGRALADYAAKAPELLALAERCGFKLTPAREHQLNVLIVFSRQHALRGILEPQLLAEAAITAMNNYLINHYKPFWDTISDSSAFTQYLLAVRAPASQEALAGLVGAAFAQRCGQEDNPDLRALGASVFSAARDRVASQWAAG